MEDVLDVYQRPYDAAYPQVCLDEASKQLIGETRVPVAAAAGQPAREDYEYVRNGTASLFMMFEPLTGQRHVEVDWPPHAKGLCPLRANAGGPDVSGGEEGGTGDGQSQHPQHRQPV